MMESFRSNNEPAPHFPGANKVHNYLFLLTSIGDLSFVLQPFSQTLYQTSWLMPLIQEQSEV